MEGKGNGFFSRLLGRSVKGVEQKSPVLVGTSTESTESPNVVVGKTGPVKSLEPSAPVLATRGTSTDRKNQGK